MTREEAILKIEYIRDGNDFAPTDAQVKALDMAIEALHREEAEAKGYCHRIKPKGGDEE